jgi:U32 family peptidase
VKLHVLCRSLEQIEAAADCGAASVLAEFRETSDALRAVEACRSRGILIFLAAPRIQKPGEMEIVERLLACRADGLLVRNLASLAKCVVDNVPALADFSLGAANELTVAHLRHLGAQRVTAAFDLGPEGLLALARRVPLDWLEVVVHARIPMIHTEHCLFAATRGKTPGDCGQACRNEVRLRDRRGVEHPLRADAACRNTLFHSQPQGPMEAAGRLAAAGVRHFRIELLDGDPPGELRRAVSRFRNLLNRPL